MHLQILFINNGYVWSCHILNKVILRVKGSDRESDYDKLANFLLKKVIIQAQVKTKAIVIHMRTRMLIWLPILTLRVLMKKVKLEEAPKLERHPKISDGVGGNLSFMTWYSGVSLFLHHH